MDSKVVLLLFACILIGFYMQLDWLVMMLVVFLFFALLSSLSKPKNKAVQKAPEEIIYPVIYEDVGESPFLYHPETTISVNPNWTPEKYWAKAAKGMGNVFGTMIKVAKGKKMNKGDKKGDK